MRLWNNKTFILLFIACLKPKLITFSRRPWSFEYWNGKNPGSDSDEKKTINILYKSCFSYFSFIFFKTTKMYFSFASLNLTVIFFFVLCFMTNKWKLIFNSFNIFIWDQLIRQKRFKNRNEIITIHLIS